jgi:hypothetical protein
MLPAAAFVSPKNGEKGFFGSIHYNLISPTVKFFLFLLNF